MGRGAVLEPPLHSTYRAGDVLNRSLRPARWIWLSGGVGQGASDEAGSIDYKPTDTQMQVLDVIEKELASAKAGFDRLQATDIPAFNKLMAGKVPEIK